MCICPHIKEVRTTDLYVMSLLVFEAVVCATHIWTSTTDPIGKVTLFTLPDKYKMKLMNFFDAIRFL